MRKKITALMMLVLLLLCGCKGQQTSEASVQVRELTSQPGGVHFTFPEEWTVYQSGQEGDEAGSTFTEEYALVAEHRVTGSGIAIIYEDLNRIQGGNLVRMEDYLTVFQENLKLSRDYHYRCSEVGLTELYGEEYYTFSAEVTQPDLKQQFYIRRMEDRIMVMTVTVSAEDSLQQLLNYGRSL